VTEVANVIRRGSPRRRRLHIKGSAALDRNAAVPTGRSCRLVAPADDPLLPTICSCRRIRTT